MWAPHAPTLRPKMIAAPANSTKLKLNRNRSRSLPYRENEMWDQLPLDLLSHIFSFLPPDSLACCISSCKPWRSAAALSAASPSGRPSAPWLLALQCGQSSCCHAFNPLRRRWHSLPLRFLPFPIRPLAPINSLLLCKLANSPALRLLLCNPFTRQFTLLPTLASARTNPAIGIVTTAAAVSFSIFVAGGASGASYEQNVEVYHSKAGTWSPAGAMPMEFSVRLTVWTPNESVSTHDGAILYWMTSARAYSVVGYDVRSGEWREVRAPMADRLEWAALVRRRGGGRVGLVGGSESGEGFVWELREGDEWVVVGAVPAVRRRNAGSVKCVGGGEVVYLFRDVVGSEMLVGDVSRDRVEWSWIEGCCGSLPKAMSPVKALLVHPSLSTLSITRK